METQSPKRSVRSSVQRMGDTVTTRDVPRRYAPPARTPTEGRGSRWRRQQAALADVDGLLAAGRVSAAESYVTPFLGRLEAIAFTGSAADLHSRAAIVDDAQDVAREQYRRGDLTTNQYRYHLTQQLRYTLAELRALEARRD